MQDAVADVLIERKALERSAWTGVPVSIFLHVTLAAALVLSAQPNDTPRKNIINVRFAAAPHSVEKKPVAAALSAANRAAELEPPPPKPEPEPPKEKAPPALKNQETLFGQAAKPKTAEPDEPAPPKPAEPVTPGATFAEERPAGIGVLPGVGTAGVTGLEGDFPYTFYVERMIGLVGRHWLRPESGSDVIVVVYYRIDRGGRIYDARISRASGSGVFDRAALRAILEASPLPPLPGGYRDRYLGVHLTFH